MRPVIQWSVRIAGGLASRWRNLWYRALGVRVEGYCWLRNIRIPRQWEDIRLEKGVGLDDGVILLCTGVRKADKLVLGRDCYVNRYTIFDAHEHIEVGPRAMIGPHCYITDADHSYEQGKAVMDQPMRSKPVIIGEEAWMGAHVVVLPGVTVGRGAVVGANSIVNRDIPDDAVAVGAPARVVRMRQPRHEDELRGIARGD